MTRFIAATALLTVIIGWSLWTAVGWGPSVALVALLLGGLVYLGIRREGPALGWLGARSRPKDVISLEWHGGRIARAAALLDGLSRKAGIPTPELSVIDAEQINAFAIQSEDRVNVSVTNGFLDSLDDEQAEALLALQVARVKSGAAESASVGALIAGWIAHLASFRMAGRTDTDGNPLAVPTATLAAPFAAVARKTFISDRQERMAEVMAVELISRPMALVRALQRAEFTAHVKPMVVPAALAATAVVNPHLGVPGLALSRVYGMGRSVSERFPEFMWDDGAAVPTDLELRQAA